MKPEWREEGDRGTGKQRLLFAKIVSDYLHMETSKRASEAAKARVLVTIQ